jgi:polyhydroxybutyrate depolymerase
MAGARYERNGGVARVLRTLLVAGALVGSGCHREPPTTKPAPAPAVTQSAIAARPYAMHVPAHHDDRAPLLVFLHGFGRDHAHVESHFGLDAFSDEKGIFVALPDGTPDPGGRRFWNASDGCCNFSHLPVDDVAYLDAVIADAVATHPIDPARVYVVGYSNGGFMAHRYACERADHVAAVASLAGEPWSDASLCKPSVPISVLQVHGDRDAVIHYGGAPAITTDASLPLGAYPASREAIAMWARLDRCAAPTTTDDPHEEILRYAGCADGTDVALWTLHGATHKLDEHIVDMHAVWAFLAAHARTSPP